MKKLNLNELGCFITIYFGQDYDLIDDSDEIEPKIDAFIKDSHRASLYGLLADIDLLTDESDNLAVEFMERYGDEFDPELWGTTPEKFLQQVRDKLSKALQAESH